ncbi:diguanylate cyclase [Aureimonas phyllosphaerae]|uniref:GGDEF domain-containing protein n=1 Tax=Aureimonas phyllosphaerae TaxID=1166078 RepID=UPI003A5C6197
MRADILAWSVPVLFCAFALCFLLLSRLHASLRWWSAGFFVASLGFALTILPTAPGSVAKPTFEDTLFLIALAIANAAFAARAGRRPRWAWLALVVGAGSAGAAVSLAFLGGSVLHEVFSVQTACAALMLLSAIEMRHDPGTLRPLLVGLCGTITVSLGLQNVLLLYASPEDLGVSNWRESPWGFVFQLNGAATGILLALSVILTTVFDVIGRLREESTADALTGALNRRGLEQGVEAMRRRTLPGRRLTLVLSDLDHFKQINDRYGHEAGDAVLCGYAALCSGLAGADGLVARIGGEEFAIVVAGGDRASALELAETVRTSARQIRWPAPLTDLTVTASSGVVAINPQETLFDAIDRADRLLYSAKADGRDKVVIDIREAVPEPAPKRRRPAGPALAG